MPEPGRNLLHYRLIDKIGEGGMGVVWRAEDTTLRREVAIKILPDAVAGDEQRLARFGREARLLATVNHPNIASVYGLHEADGVHFLAMELVRGEDLAQTLARRCALPIDEAVEIAHKVADALTAAHAQGVVHRDLKPANVLLGEDGTVKVLDFGLAKATAAALGAESSGGGDPSASPSFSPTMTSLGTVDGVLMGTAAYMSPEQARGKPVDARTDVWAFGCVLYEMLAGQRAFPGETITDTLAAVIRGEPDWERLPAALPRGVRRVLELCLAKKADARLRDVGDAKLLLDAALGESHGTDSAAVVDTAQVERARLGERRAWRVALATIALAITAGAIVALVAIGGRGGSAGAGATGGVRFTLQLDPGAPYAFADNPNVAISPDGRRLAYIATDPSIRAETVHLRELDRAETVSLTETIGATTPFFSPDGSEIAYFADSGLWRIPVAGGAPTAVAGEVSSPRGGVWLADGSLIYSPTFSSGLWRVDADGGPAAELVHLDADRRERTFRWPTATPDGKTIFFTVGSVESPNNYDAATLAAFDLASGKRTDLFDGVNMARFLPPDRLVFIRAGTLYAVQYDARAVAVDGAPIQLLADVGGDPSSGAGYFDLSRRGDLVYIGGAITSARSNLILIDRDGSRTPLPIEPNSFYHPRFSPDGTRLAYTVGRGSRGITGDLWSFDFASNAPRRLTFGGVESYPMWSPDGTRIAFSSAIDTNLFVRASDGGGDLGELVINASGFLLPGSWSPDGKRIATTLTEARSDVVLYEVDGGTMMTVAEDASGPVISPDGNWIAYGSPASGGPSLIYVESMHDEGKWQVSVENGNYPRWSIDGKSLFWIRLGDGASTRAVMEVTVQDGATAFRSTRPRVVLENIGEYVTSTAPMVNWDTDGERFAFVEWLRDEQALLRVEVALGWGSAVLGGAEDDRR